MAVQVLSANQRMRIGAANDYRNHPAADNWERLVNEARAWKAERDAEAIGRIINRLSGEQTNES